MLDFDTFARSTRNPDGGWTFCLWEELGDGEWKMTLTVLTGDGTIKEWEPEPPQYPSIADRPLPFYATPEQGEGR